MKAEIKFFVWTCLFLFATQPPKSQAMNVHISGTPTWEHQSVELLLNWQAEGVWSFEIWKSTSILDTEWERLDEIQSVGTQKNHSYTLHVSQNQSPSYYKVIPKSHPLNGIDEIDLGGGISMGLARIPAGSFIMGAPETSGLGTSVQPLTSVMLSKPFLMGKHEITQRQWHKIMGYNPSNDIGENRPVETVVWWAADAFCRVLTERARRNGSIPSNYRVTLPTEAQWEYACRAGTQTSFYFGEDPMESMLQDHAWYLDSAPPGPWNKGTQPVGMLMPNPWGLFDMHGNVAEFCLDSLGTYPGGHVVDPMGSLNGFRQTFRGGQIFAHHNFCQSAVRGGFAPGQIASHAVGFRIVVTENDEQQ